METRAFLSQASTRRQLIDMLEPQVLRLLLLGTGRFFYQDLQNKVLLSGSLHLKMLKYPQKTPFGERSKVVFMTKKFTFL